MIRAVPRAHPRVCIRVCVCLREERLREKGGNDGRTKQDTLCASGGREREREKRVRKVRIEASAFRGDLKMFVLFFFSSFSFRFRFPPTANQVRARVRVILLDRREALRKSGYSDPRVQGNAVDPSKRTDPYPSRKRINQEAIAARVYVDKHRHTRTHTPQSALLDRLATWGRESNGLWWSGWRRPSTSTLEIKVSDSWDRYSIRRRRELDLEEVQASLILSVL